MANNVYFGNSVADTASVNVNNAMMPAVLTPRSTTEDDKEVVTVINCPVAQIPTSAFKARGVFATGGGDANKNTIAIQFEELEQNPQTYEVVTEDLSGRDLYFYVFEGSLVGQDETGRSKGITITPVAPPTYE